MYLEYSVLITKVCEYDCTHSIYGGSGVFICKRKRNDDGLKFCQGDSVVWIVLWC